MKRVEKTDHDKRKQSIYMPVAMRQVTIVIPKQPFKFHVTLELVDHKSSFDHSLTKLKVLSVIYNFAQKTHYIERKKKYIKLCN